MDIDRLLRSLAHELKQPLTAIMANAEAALRMAAGKHPDLTELREILADIVAESRRAADALQAMRSRVTDARLAPEPAGHLRAPWNDFLTRAADGDHIVHLYRDERSLVEAVALFAGTGLGQGDAVLLVATPPHVEAILQRLEGAGHDIDRRRRERDLTTLDAATLLSRFTVNGLPDAGAFESLVGDLLGPERAGGRGRVRAYGEMVNLLWRDNLPAAARLEQLWNGVISSRPVSLLCSYCLEGHTDSNDSFPPELAEAHSRLIPVEAWA